MKGEKGLFQIQETIWVKVCELKEHEGFPFHLMHSTFTSAHLLSRDTVNIRVKKAEKMWSMDSIRGINSSPLHTSRHATFGTFLLRLVLARV